MDASTRLIGSIVQSRAVGPGRQALYLLDSLLEQLRDQPESNSPVVPDQFWTVRPEKPGQDGAERVLLRGAVTQSDAENCFAHCGDMLHND